MSGVRVSPQLRYLLLGVTVLAVIVGALLTQQTGHSTDTSAAGEHSAIPVLIHEAAPHEVTPMSAEAAEPAVPPAEDHQQTPPGSVLLHLWMTMLAGAFGLWLIAAAFRPSCGDSTPPGPTRAGRRGSTSASAPTPVLSNTCVLRV